MTIKEKVLKETIRNKKLVEYTSPKLYIEKAIDLTLAKRNKEVSKVIKGNLGVTEIQNNMEKSFKGSIGDALKNNYVIDKHYVIVDWVFFHELLNKEKELKQKLGIK